MPRSVRTPLRAQTKFQGFGSIQTTQLASNKALILDLRSRQGDIGLIVDSPALALFANREFRADRGNIATLSDQARLLLQEWMLGQRNAGGPDELASGALTGVRQRIERNPFEQVFPNVGANGAGISVTRELFNPLSIDNLGRTISVGVKLPNLSAEAAFQELLKTFGALPRYSTQSTNNRLSFGSGNDIVMPGYLGNSEVAMGEGDDIYLASPHLFAAVLSGNNVSSGSGTADAKIFYPTAYSLLGTAANSNGNTILTEGGNDLIYYDSSINSANGGGGDDVFAPSFGSFNWAIDTLIQGPSNLVTFRDSNRRIENFSRRNNNQNAAEREIGIAGLDTLGSRSTSTLQTFVHGDAALISPVTQLRTQSNEPDLSLIHI